MAEHHEPPDQHQIDLRTILEEVRAHVRSQRLSQGAPNPLEQELAHSLDDIELYRVISAHWPIQGKTLPQRAMALVNKLVRRYLRWYINPIVEQQNAYNDVVARMLRLLAESYAELSEQLRVLDLPGSNGLQPRDIERGPAQGPDEASVPDRAQPSDTDRASYTALMALLQERAAAEPPARFPDLALRDAEVQLRLRQEVTAHWPLYGTTLLQQAIALLNKLVRRYLRWYINPIVEQQNAANTAFSSALAALVALDALQRAELAKRRRTVEGCDA